jgi:Arc/MetJ-type ribon-helix-helix transcriptional regulator
MDLHLTPEQQRIITEELQSGHFRTVEEVIAEALKALQAKRPSSNAEPNGAQREAVREMLAFVEKNYLRV